jgi:heme-degrading monooxygenase HmoA
MGGATGGDALLFVVRARVKPGSDREFLRRYERLAARVGQGLPGHRDHVLARDLDDPERWLIVSRWDSLAASDAWDSSPEHRELLAAMRECWVEVERDRAGVVVETLHPKDPP